MALLDLRTGEQVTEDIALAATNQLGQHNGDFAVLPESNVLIISAQQAIHALPLQRVRGAGADDL